MRKVVQKALNGEQIAVGVVGGSITCGHGVVRGTEDWFARVENYLRAAFPSATWRMRNGCVAATMSEYTSMCLDHFVDEDVDLMFIEYTVNDGYVDSHVNNTRVHAFERLMRKLLSKPHAPAVVLMQFLHMNAHLENRPFYATIEDHYGVLAQYYGTSWLSVRNAVWHSMWHDSPGYRFDEWLLKGDERHPSPRGGKYMADLVAALVQEVYMDLVTTPLREDDVFVDSIPEPMFPGNHPARNMACLTGLDLRAIVAAHEDWYFVNEGTSNKQKWGFVSHVVNATMVFSLDTRASGAKPLPVLTEQQKQAIQQESQLHGHAGTVASGSHAVGGGGVGGAAGVDAAGVPLAGPGGSRPTGPAAGEESVPQWMAASREAELIAQQAPDGQVQPGSMLAGAALPGASAAAAGPAVLLGQQTPPLLNVPGAFEKIVGAHDTKVKLPMSALLPVEDNPNATVVVLTPAKDAPPAKQQQALAAPPLSGAGRRLLARDLGTTHRDLKQSEAKGAVEPILQLPDMLVWVGYLKSYRYMGMARIFCVAGCRCKDTMVNAQHEHQTSQTFLVRVPVTQAENCTMGIQVSNWTATGHHKFKVISVMLSRNVDYGAEIDFTDMTMTAALAAQPSAR